MDIGGANTKAAWLDGASLRTVSRPFEIWRDRDALVAVLRESPPKPVPADAVAITMTAELSDAFRTKREGVAFVLDAAQDALGELRVLTVDGELMPAAVARARPWDVAAANWVATRARGGRAPPRRAADRRRQHDHRRHPVVGGRVAASGRNDLDRLLAGELVYTGVLRTNLAAIAREVPVRGGWCPVASELSRSAPTCTWSSAGCPGATTARRPTAARPRWPSRASGSPGSCAPTSSSSTTARSTRSPRSCTTSRCGRSRPRRAASRAAGGPVVTLGSGASWPARSRRGWGARSPSSLSAPTASAPAAALAALLAARLC